MDPRRRTQPRPPMATWQKRAACVDSARSTLNQWSNPAVCVHVLCLFTCLPACLQLCAPSCSRACMMPAYLRARAHVGSGTPMPLHVRPCARSCLHALAHACLTACSPACSLACLPACARARLPASSHAYVLARHPASLHACVPARVHMSVRARLSHTQSCAHAVVRACVVSARASVLARRRTHACVPA